MDHFSGSYLSVVAASSPTCLYRLSELVEELFTFLSRFSHRTEKLVSLLGDKCAMFYGDCDRGSFLLFYRKSAFYRTSTLASFVKWRKAA